MFLQGTFGGSARRVKTPPSALRRGGRAEAVPREFEVEYEEAGRGGYVDADVSDADRTVELSDADRTLSPQPTAAGGGRGAGGGGDQQHQVQQQQQIGGALRQHTVQRQQQLVAAAQLSQEKATEQWNRTAEEWEVTAQVSSAIASRRDCFIPGTSLTRVLYFVPGTR
eukprot:COSAG06_NODE_917_length_11555_cov_62.488041_11_plen_168_part_00